jgi:cytochrome c biogenesis protein CcdA
MLVTLAFALAAGMLSILSPCVLPILPLVLGTAGSEHRAGPVVLAAGLALSFTAVGLFVATAGFAVGLDGTAFRTAGAILMLAFGALLLAPAAQARLAAAGGPFGDWVEQRFGGFSTAGLSGQFGVGLLLGFVWSPCVGPTLGAASVMAAKSENLVSVALTMAAFGLGAGLPLIVLGFASRQALLSSRARLSGAGGLLRKAMGAALVVVALLVLSGHDKTLEGWAVEHSPDWLTNLTTRF